MKATLRLMVALVVPALVARDVAAQWNVERLGSTRNQVYTTFGLDPAFVASVGYQRVVPMLGRSWQFGAEAGVVTEQLDIRDYRARVEIRSSIVWWRSVHLVGSAAFITRGTENSIYRAIAFGSDFTGTLGVYRPHWFLAGEFGFDKAIITHLTQSDWYRQFYPEAKDGWYLNAGGTFHYGPAAGVVIGPAELALRAGWRRTENFKDVTPPIYGVLGVGFRF
jgi:hypothetical protein